MFKKSLFVFDYLHHNGFQRKTGWCSGVVGIGFRECLFGEVALIVQDKGRRAGRDREVERSGCGFRMTPILSGSR